ncbi:class I SAM-dependent methyltransferase [Flexivirga alba]|uniref:Class I SAM-dependent methyltransferase n=1 Tax=Flexivirga alba TaxID=702742 RepID=A0ABW2AFC8_9MICO
MSVTSSAHTSADAVLKQRHRTMWASGNYPRIARELVAPLGRELVTALGIGPGDRVLDVAAGTGNASVPAALTGADVTASDLTPELLDAGRAGAPDARVTWDVADAEALPYADGSFHIVMSCIGVMFAPHHQQAAGEMARVCRPGGRIGVLSWTPDGTIGQLFAAMRDFMPPPPPGAAPPPLWGDEQHVRELFDGVLEQVTAQRHVLPVSFFSDAAAFCDYFHHYYGPSVSTYRLHADEPDRIQALNSAVTEVAERANTATDGGFTMDWGFLLVTGYRV